MNEQKKNGWKRVKKGTEVAVVNYELAQREGGGEG